MSLEHLRPEYLLHAREYGIINAVSRWDDVGWVAGEEAPSKRKRIREIVHVQFNWKSANGEKIVSQDSQHDMIGKGLEWAPAIQHPLDRMYLKRIEGIPLLPKIMGWVIDHQRQETEAFLAGDGILVTEASCSVAEAAFRGACEALSLDRSLFRFFVEAEADINAFTTGSGGRSLYLPPE